ncbi:MAG: cold shock domain-containing protein [Chlorobiales bacterium]|nr:cold shock domain-containing protein [Chlorobiales bacterium]
MKGKDCQWKEDNGFGFIQPDDGSDKLFFHVSSVKTNARRPQTGDVVLFYVLTYDSQQRLQAKGVVIEGVGMSHRSAIKNQSSNTGLPKKNALDYISILVLLSSLTAVGFELYRSSSIESSLPFGISAIVAFFVLNRQKKPKEKSFSCSRCKKITEHDTRTIQAWNNGFIRLYCEACHRQWLKDNPLHENIQMNSKSGCFGVMALLVVLPILGGVSLYHWLA